MCTKPVAKITPAATALASTNPASSVRKSRRFLPASGMEIPTTPEIRIATMAVSFRSKTEDSSRQVSEDGTLLKVLQGLLEKDADAVSVVENELSQYWIFKKKTKNIVRL